MGNPFFCPTLSRTSFADSSDRTQPMDSTAHSLKRFYQRKKKKACTKHAEQLLNVQNKMYNQPKMNYLHLDFKTIKSIFKSERKLS